MALLSAKLLAQNLPCNKSLRCLMKIVNIHYIELACKIVEISEAGEICRDDIKKHIASYLAIDLHVVAMCKNKKCCR